MPGFNRVTLVGNLTRDPQIRQLPTATVTDFGLAVTRHYRPASGEDREEVCFVDCTAFGKQADTIAQHCRKGKLLLVEGRLKYDVWDDKAGNGKRSKLSVVVENFQFLSPPTDRPEASRPDGDSQLPSVERPQRRRKQEDPALLPAGAVKDSEIPF